MVILIVFVIDLVGIFFGSCLKLGEFGSSVEVGFLFGVVRVLWRWVRFVFVLTCMF